MLNILGNRYYKRVNAEEHFTIRIIGYNKDTDLYTVKNEDEVYEIPITEQDLYTYTLIPYSGIMYISDTSEYNMTTNDVMVLLTSSLKENKATKVNIKMTGFKAFFSDIWLDEDDMESLYKYNDNRTFACVLPNTKMYDDYIFDIIGWDRKGINRCVVYYYPDDTIYTIMDIIPKHLRINYDKIINENYTRFREYNKDIPTIKMKVLGIPYDLNDFILRAQMFRIFNIMNNKYIVMVDNISEYIIKDDKPIPNYIVKPSLYNPLMEFLNYNPHDSVIINYGLDIDITSLDSYILLHDKSLKDLYLLDFTDKDYIRKYDVTTLSMISRQQPNVIPDFLL